MTWQAEQYPKKEMNGARFSGSQIPDIKIYVNKGIPIY